MSVFEGINNRFLDRAEGYFRNIRVLDGRAYLGMALLGYIQGINKPFFTWENSTTLLKFFLTIMLYLRFSFSINNCFDVDCDRKGRKLKKNPVASGQISLQEGIFQSLAIALTGLILTYFWFNTQSLVLYFSMTFLSAAYSTPPLRFKSVPIVDLISHGLFFGSLISLYGTSITGRFNNDAIFLTMSIFLFSMILELRNHIEDVNEDDMANIKTTVCWLSLEKAKKLLMMLMITHWLIMLTLLAFTSIKLFIIITTVTSCIFSLLLFLKSSSNYYLRATDVLTCIIYSLFTLIPLTVLQ